MAINTPSQHNNPSQQHGTGGQNRMGAEAKDKAANAAAAVGHKAQDLAANAGHKAQEFAASAAEKAENAMGAVGSQMTRLAGTIREKAPHEGPLGTAATTVAENLQAGGRYLQEHDLADMSKEVTQMVRKHPLPSLLMGFGLGCLLGMTLSRR